MPEPTDGEGFEEVTPEEGFSLLGHGTRIGIIRALWRAGNDAVSFSELRERADVTDSGQFNYHLGELVGTFLRREGEGYDSPTPAGRSSARSSTGRTRSRRR